MQNSSIAVNVILSFPRVGIRAGRLFDPTQLSGPPGVRVPGHGHSDGLGASPGFISVIEGLLPMALCGRSSL